MKDIKRQTQYDKEPLKNMDLRIKMLDFFIENNFDGNSADYKKILPDEDGGFENLVETDEKFKAVIAGEEYINVFCAYGLVSNAIFRVAVGLDKIDEEDDE